MLWRSENAIVVGKHQNAMAEINLPFVRQKQIKVARRISGGGTVFHDLGNLNFTFIANGKEGSLIDFRKFTQPVIDVLKELGIHAEFGGRNDLRVDGKKISGNAEHVWKKRTLHHGTILFSSDISDLSGALKVNPLQYTDRAVKSVRSKVTNLSDHLKETMDVIEFRDRIMKHILENYKDSRIYEFSKADLETILRLKEEKFDTWEWTFGYSPKYNLSKSIRTDEGNVKFSLDVEKGTIRDLGIEGNVYSAEEIEYLNQFLSGVRHDPEEVSQIIEKGRTKNLFSGRKLEVLLKGIF